MLFHVLDRQVLIPIARMVRSRRLSVEQQGASAEASPHFKRA
jgi:hypothetical protein